MRKLRDEATFRKWDYSQPLLRPLVADIKCGRGYGVEFFEPLTAEVVPELERWSVTSITRCFAHE